MASAKSIAVVISSTRPQRINPFVAGYVASVINSIPQTTAKVELLDLATLNLPLFNEPLVPGEVPADDPTPHYHYEYTRAWSALVRKYDGFIFVTPQYNWSIPASLKNALDYIFHEWNGKPAAIVTYGFRGGVKAEPHLREILTGLRMVTVEPTVALKIVKGEPGEREKQMEETWKKDKADEKITTLFDSLLRHFKANN
ncbi:NADPH-dependent FMN reductase Lot6 [Trichoderma simmonsii]|uniref:NADPH-dependent FMN reductase Lot6 n=1 Tax=Trichoderma simmonsii TaxID=1491479 RepID=A0A8G0LPK7_9HYPO|nr:NADPH-dependent FMN reductase Lot6 [Trichoderma simmonsii]